MLFIQRHALDVILGCMLTCDFGESYNWHMLEALCVSDHPFKYKVWSE